MQTNTSYFHFAVLMYLSVLLPVLQVKGQESIKFQKTYGSENSTSPVAMEKTADDGYLMLGNTAIIIPDSGLVETDFQIIRTEADGAYRWAKNFGSLKDDSGYDILETVNRQILIAAQSQSPEDLVSYPTLVMLNPQGFISWASSYTAPNSAFVALATSQDSNYFALGQGDEGTFLFKINEQGTPLWNNSFDLNINDSRTALQATLDGGCVIAGNLGEDIFLLKVDKNGKNKWLKTYGGLRKDVLGGIIETETEELVISGVTYNYGPNGRSQPSIMLFQTESDGDIIWGRAYGDDSFSWNQSLCLDYDGSYRLAGYRGQSGQPQNLLLITTDLNGELLRTQELTNTEHAQGGFSMFSTPDSGVAILGSLQKFNPSSGGEAFYFVKADANGDSGKRPKNLTYQSSQASPYVESQRVKPLRSSVTKKWGWAQANLEAKDAGIRERLLAGNVSKPLDPRQYVLAQARMRDSLALVALYDSTDGPNWRRTWDLSKPLEEWYNVHLNYDGRVSSIILTANRLAGVIPAMLGNLDQLQVLWLNTNRLEGSIPPEFGKLKSLQQLYLENNRLSGEFPLDLTELEKLQQVKLGNNQLTGVIPAELVNMKSLTQLNLENNFFSGEIPTELDTLTARSVTMDLSNNRLEGAIPQIMLSKKTDIGLLGNNFEDHYQTKLIDKLGGQYESINTDSASFRLTLNETTRRFTLMEAKYGDEGGRYRIIKGNYFLEEDHLNLKGEIMEMGSVGSEASETPNSEPYEREIPVTFDDTRQPIQVTLNAFDRDLLMNKL